MYSSMLFNRSTENVTKLFCNYQRKNNISEFPFHFKPFPSDFPDLSGARKKKRVFMCVSLTQKYIHLCRQIFFSSEILGIKITKKIGRHFKPSPLPLVDFYLAKALSMVLSLSLSSFLALVLACLWLCL